MEFESDSLIGADSECETIIGSVGERKCDDMAARSTMDKDSVQM